MVAPRSPRHCWAASPLPFSIVRASRSWWFPPDRPPSEANRREPDPLDPARVPARGRRLITRSPVRRPRRGAAVAGRSRGGSGCSSRSRRDQERARGRSRTPTSSRLGALGRAMVPRLRGKGAGKRRDVSLEVPQPSVPPTPAVPNAPVTPAVPDPGTPAHPQEPATVPVPQEPPTPTTPDPEPAPEPESPNEQAAYALVCR